MHLAEPVLWRSTGELQVGTTSPRILSGLTSAEVALLQGLTRPRSPAWIARTLADGGISESRWAELRALIQTRSRPRDVRSGRVLLLDSHPLTAHVGQLLADRGFPVVTEAVGRVGGAPGLPTRGPALALLTDAWVTDPVRTAPLMRHDVPHLPLVVDDGVSVGPVVVPGATACTWCLQLARTDADGAWPSVALQLRVLPFPPVDEPAFAAHLAAWVAASFVSGTSTRGWRLADGDLLPVAVALHPRCACREPAETESYRSVDASHSLTTPKSCGP